MAHGGERSESTITGYGAYVAIWAVLIVLLVLTVLIARIGPHQQASLVNIVIASVKAAVVLWFFMHLRHEGWFIRATLLMAVVTLSLVILLTFADVWYR